MDSENDHTTTSTDANEAEYQIPRGYKFTPSDQELVVGYLRQKANSLPLPANIIPHITDLFHHSPWDLPGKIKEKRFFFSTKTTNYSCCIINTRGGCGYWKHQSDKDMGIVAPGTRSVVAIKKYWGFYLQNNIETDWIMHQFSLVRAFDVTLTNKKMVEVGKWMVCRIYDGYEEEKDNQFDVDVFASSSSSSSSSESESDLDQEANSEE